MVIVIAILGIVATFAVPAFQNYVRNRNLKTAAQESRRKFFVTRERSLSENNAYQIVFDSGTNQYSVQQPPGTNITTKEIAASASAQDGIVIDTSIAQRANFHVSAARNDLVGDDQSEKQLNSRAAITVNFPSRTYVVYNLQ